LPLNLIQKLFSLEVGKSIDRFCECLNLLRLLLFVLFTKVGFKLFFDLLISYVCIREKLFNLCDVAVNLLIEEFTLYLFAIKLLILIQQFIITLTLDINLFVFLQSFLYICQLFKIMIDNRLDFSFKLSKELFLLIKVHISLESEDIFISVNLFWKEEITKEWIALLDHFIECKWVIEDVVSALLLLFNGGAYAF